MKNIDKVLALKGLILTPIKGASGRAPHANISAAVNSCCLSRRAPTGLLSSLTLCWPLVRFTNIMLCSWYDLIKYLLSSTWLILKVS